METNIEGDTESASTVSSLLGEGLNISDLPWEVLQEIFCHVDGKSLLICKRVCKDWREHVHHLEQKTSFWYNNCQKEIPSWTQFDLLDNMFPSHWKDQSRVDWEEIYKCWSIWNSLFEAPVTKFKLVSGLNGISSVKVSGEWLFISTCGGRGKLSAQRFTGTGGLVDFYIGGGAILNFELVISDRNSCSNVKPSTELNEIFDTLEHNEIWLELKDCYIQLGKTYCHTRDKIQQKISHSYGYEVRLVSDCHCSTVILKKICSKVNGPELMDLEVSCPYTQILEFWMNTISLCAIKFKRQVIVDAVSVNRRTQQATLTSSFGYSVEGETCAFYSWHGSLFVIFTNKRKIMIHQNGKEKVQVTPIKKGKITSVLFYANYFFLGTDKGKLLIYKVNSPDDCLTIAIYETPCWDIEVCNGNIIDIVIAEPVHHKFKLNTSLPVEYCRATGRKGSAEIGWSDSDSGGSRNKRWGANSRFVMQIFCRDEEKRSFDRMCNTRRHLLGLDIIVRFVYILCQDLFWRLIKALLSPNRSFSAI